MWSPVILDVECIVCNKSLQKINHNPRHTLANMGKVSNNRRTRTPNWSLEEKQYLLELIRERKDVVVTKSNNGPNYSEEKDVAWTEIMNGLALKFGKKFHGSSIKKVKTQWQNMKRIAREEIASNGLMLQNYSWQSLEVCNILEVIKEGKLKMESEDLNETIITTDVEIKAEFIEENDGENRQPSCSGIKNNSDSSLTANENNNIDQFDIATASVSEQNLGTNESEMLNIVNSSATGIQEIGNRKNASVMTEISNIDNGNFNNINKDMQEYLLYTSKERQIKIESLNEERQIIRAMRETAELNKIIAEQKLKHLLWMKKQEFMMYVGEPGSGAGKGGGGGGSIREAGGAFGKMEAAREDEYFYKKQKEQLQNMKKHLDQEISFHAEQIKRHEDAINRHKSKLADMEKK